jgi:hypothetical protein
LTFRMPDFDRNPAPDPYRFGAMLGAAYSCPNARSPACAGSRVPVFARRGRSTGRDAVRWYLLHRHHEPIP